MIIDDEISDLIRLWCEDIEPVLTDVENDNGMDIRGNLCVNSNCNNLTQ